MSEQMLTEDRRCGHCGEPVVDIEGEPRDQIEVDGFLQTVSMSYLLKPCGHVFTKAVA